MPEGFRLLTEEGADAIHNASIEILEKTGVTVKNHGALRTLEEAGCAIEGQSARIPGELVEECLRGPPSGIGLYARDGDQRLEVGGDNVLYNPGSSAIYFLDGGRGELRRARSEDLVRLVRLVDGLEHIRAQSTAVVPSDVADEIADLYRLYIVLKNSTKPVVTGAFTKEGLIDMANMLGAVAGGMDELARAPRAIFDCCPTSPLMWGDTICQNLIDCAELGIPAEIIPAPQMGATSPVSIAGTLVQSNAETLSGVVISQLTKRGAPVIYGGSPSAFDMRHCTARLGSVEAVMTACAGAELGRSYGLPTHGYLGLSDSKVVDGQSGLESAIGIVLAAQARVNVVSGPGMLASENCQSLEKLVIDDEICGLAHRLIDGVRLDGEALAVDVIRKVGPGGHFLGEKHTRVNLRREQFIPSDLVCRLTIDAWRKGGSTDVLGRAQERVRKILGEHQPKPLSGNEEEALESVFKSILMRHGLNHPQPHP